MIGEDMTAVLLAEARAIQQRNPGMAVTLTVSAGIWYRAGHDPVINWHAGVGHREIVTAKTLAELNIAIDAVSSHEMKLSKLARAAELRREADALEAEVARDQL